MNSRDYQRYDPLIRIRKTQKQLSAQKLAKTLTKIKDIEQEIANMESLQQEYMKYVRMMQEKSSKAQDISETFSYIVYLGKQIDVLKREKSELENIAEMQRKELEEVMVEEKMLQKLKENRERVFQNWIQKEIQKSVDDLSCMRFSMMKKENS